MNDKSHVSLEQHVCLVCGKAFDTGTILLDKRLRQSLAQIESFYSPVGILPGVTVSIGMAQMQDKDGLESLIARADCALYKAKQQGRNCLYG